MFTYYMSYAQLRQALSQKAAEKSMLNKHEQTCLRLSLTDPFLVKMLSLYRLPSLSQAVVTRTQERERALHRRVHQDENVHSAIYGGIREKVAAYLAKNYPVQPEFPLMSQLEDFVEDMLSNPTVDYELQIAEAERYAKRVELHRIGELRVCDPIQTLDEIKTDFREYLQHLQIQKQAKTTYAWHALESLFRRLENIGGLELSEARLTLMRALDDTRTGYHDQDEKYVLNKNYSCQKGLEQRLLDHHCSLAPASSTPGDPIEKVTLALHEPFVDRSGAIDGALPTFSKELYQLYLEAAGYRVQRERKRVWSLKSDALVDKLRKDYMDQYSGIHRRKAEADFNSVLTLLGRGLVGTDDAREPIDFLREQGVLVKYERESFSLEKPTDLKSDQEVCERLVRTGPFIDNAHLRSVLALHDPMASLQTMKEAANAGTETDALIQTQREAMISSYNEYVLSHIDPDFPFITPDIFYPFSHPILENQLEQNNLNQLPCTEDALCCWLQKTPVGQIRALEELAILCVKAGYAAALTLLINHGLDTNYVDREERQSFLYMAAEAGHLLVVTVLIQARVALDARGPLRKTALMIAAEKGHGLVVKALVDAGADVDLEDILQKTALRIAVYHGYIDVGKILIESGVILDSQDSTGGSALMWAAFKGHIELVYLLIEAGASLDIVDRNGKTAIMWAADNRAIKTARALEAAGAALHLTDIYERTAAMRVEGHDDLEMAQIFLSATQREALQQSLFEAARSPQGAPLIYELMQSGASINKVDNEGYTALDIAIKNGHMDAVIELLRAPNITPCRLMRSLQLAIEQPSLHSIVPILLSRENITKKIIQNSLIVGPVAWAAKYDCLLAARAFVSAGADRDEPDGIGKTAREYLKNDAQSGWKEFFSTAEDFVLNPCTTSAAQIFSQGGGIDSGKCSNPRLTLRRGNL